MTVIIELAILGVALTLGFVTACVTSVGLKNTCNRVTGYYEDFYGIQGIA